MSALSDNGHGKNGPPGCLVQCGGQVIPCSSAWSVDDSIFPRPVGVCNRCGHVQLARLFQPGEYVDLNNRYFSHSYHPASACDRTQNAGKKKKYHRQSTSFKIDSKGWSSTGCRGRRGMVDPDCPEFTDGLLRRGGPTGLGRTDGPKGSCQCRRFSGKTPRRDGKGGLM